MPRAHLQGVGASPSGQPYHVYAHWTDGHADHASGRPGYPVMGNVSMNGCGNVFCVTVPTLGAPAGSAPLVVGLHGGGGHYMNFVGGANPGLGLGFEDAWVLTPDGTINTAAGPYGANWLGFWEGFDRFTSPFPYPVPDGALVVDYVTRRLLWQIAWVAEQYSIDTARISLVGHSGGARGAGLLGRAHPERFAAVHRFCAHLQAAPMNAFFGDAAQNLPTTLPGAPGVADVMDETQMTSPTERDQPFSRIVIGRNDNVSTAAWSLQKVQAYQAIDASRWGTHLFFDERGHDFPSWTGAHFDASTVVKGPALLRHRNDESFPAFFGDDQDPFAPGVQPDMGDGDPLDGDPHGTFGGYYDWEPATLVDQPSRWACTLWLTALSAAPADNFPGVVAEVGVCVRRPQAFRPAAGTRIAWRLRRAADGAVLMSGTTRAEGDGLVAVTGLSVTADPDRVRLELVALPTPWWGTPTQDP